MTSPSRSGNSCGWECVEHFSMDDECYVAEAKCTRCDRVFEEELGVHYLNFIDQVPSICITCDPEAEDGAPSLVFFLV